MSSAMKLLKNLECKKIFRWIAGSIAVLGVLFVIWVYKLNSEINYQLHDGWFAKPIELYSQQEILSVNKVLSPDTLRNWLKSWDYQDVDANERLLPGQFQSLDELQCAQLAGSPFLENTTNCVHYRTRERSFGSERDSNFYLISFDASDRISLIFSGEPLSERTQIRLPAISYAQFYEGQPILRGLVQIGEVPLECLQSVTAAEDSGFLEHSGVSWTGILRATFRNLISGRYAQGGSTITQQLVKNYFLSSERTLKRKANEMVMSLLLELKASKDEILQSYLNVIYMGQNGPFQVRGFKAASEFYIGKELGRLNLPECALLAAIINSPGRFNPSKNPENAKNRRHLVLERMLKNEYITQEGFDLATAAPLPPKPIERLGEPAAYYTQAVFRELNQMGIDESDGLRVFTQLNETAQDQAQRFTLKHVQDLESQYASLKKLKDEGKNLEAALISVDIKTGGINALVGGRHFSNTQFNRILDANRQVGSIMKPFVVLAALTDEDAQPKYTPLSLLQDAPFNYKYEGQEWSPKNYDKKFRGLIPLYQALKNSINVPIARLGIDVGLEKIISVAHEAGVDSEMKAFPSLTLGAFEIKPIEVAQAYLTIANFGLRKPIHTITRVEDLNGKVLYSAALEPDLRLSPTETAVLVSMMKQTLDSGTATLTRRLGYLDQAAGKTGTTSDTKDAWFVGFTPETLTITWTGYDDNTVSGLTGASGALPLWIDFMKAQASSLSSAGQVLDFQWPEGTELREVKDEETQTEIKLLFVD